MKFTLFVLLIGFVSNTFAQMSISAGTGILNGVGTQRKSLGFNLGLELPRSSDLTFFIRASAFLPNQDSTTRYANMTANDVTTTPYTLSVPYNIKSHTLYVEGGTRSYMLNDYDNGFALYGGSVFGIGINTTSAKFSKFDYTKQYEWEGLYSLPNANPTKGSIYYLALGIQGGFKYTIPVRGTLFFDITGTYSVLNLANNSAGENSHTYSRLNFLFQLGYRRDLY
ncbi:MAG: hypothetical protein RL737_381 [Bacteroidota bacterium]|jgi:hypothetical protein